MITVVGSYITDCVARTPHMPVPGETVLGRSFQMGPGGKGGNQAVAAARAGAKVNMITKLGNDDFGRLARENFAREGISMTFTPSTSEHPTGTALILVDDSGENMICVTLGACGAITREDILAAEESIAQSDMLVVQLETSLEAVCASIELAARHGVPVILNPAPYHEFPEELLRSVTYVTPNETEAGYMSGVDVTDDASAIRAASIIQSRGAENVIITMGKRGCLVYQGPEQHAFYPAFSLKAVDTTGAGDAFNGGFAHAISSGMEMSAAIRFASAVAGLSVTKLGAAPSMPTADEVNTFLGAQ